MSMPRGVLRGFSPFPFPKQLPKDMPSRKGNVLDGKCNLKTRHLAFPTQSPSYTFRSSLRRKGEELQRPCHSKIEALWTYFPPTCNNVGMILCLRSPLCTGESDQHNSALHCQPGGAKFASGLGNFIQTSCQDPATCPHNTFHHEPGTELGAEDTAEVHRPSLTLMEFRF